MMVVFPVSCVWRTPLLCSSDMIDPEREDISQVSDTYVLFLLLYALNNSDLCAFYSYSCTYLVENTGHSKQQYS